MQIPRSARRDNTKKIFFIQRSGTKVASMQEAKLYSWYLLYTAGGIYVILDCI